MAAGPPRARGHELSADGVTVAYDGVDVVHDAAIALRPAEVTVLVGPNGSGKSTLLRTLARLAAARAGSLTVGPGTDEAATASPSVPASSRVASPC